MARPRLLALAGLVLAGGSLDAQAPRLGSVSFPVAAPAPAQERFLRGVLFLHSFEYEAAAAEFREAQRLAPRAVMPFWGEAMTYNHPVWDQQDRTAAIAALARLAPTSAERAALAADPRERAWLEAVEILYGEGDKVRRDTLYAGAMERMAARYPDDLEVQTFYALALMGLSQTTRVIPTYMRAGAIALAAMKQNPDHPGAAHYVIHAFDDPVHAPLGLSAARAYSGIAPGAAHAQHMTTHIFLALGMWDEVVSQNIVASGPDRSRWLPGHYTSWLGYGLLQQGRLADARSHLELVRSNLGARGTPGQRGSLMFMRAQQMINEEAWSDSSLLFTIDRAGIRPGMVALDEFALAYAAIKRGNHAAAEARLPRVVDSPVLHLELDGLLRLARGDTAGGLASLRRATAIEDTLPMEFGPPHIVKPSHELLAEQLLALGHPAEARRSFQRSLALAPRRLRSLLGLYHAASREGDSVVATHAREDLRSMLGRADSIISNSL